MRSRLARLIPRLATLMLLVCGAVLATGAAAPLHAGPLGPWQPSPSRALSPVLAVQQAQRDCQTVRTCRYDRGGPYRGCLSSYTCRVCEFVQSRCRTEAGKRVCQELRCRWGG